MKGSGDNAKRSATALLVMLFASNIMASFDQSMMNIALDATSEYFHISLSMANWMVLGFSIVTGTVIMAAAALLDKLGLRKVMFIGYVATLAGSLLGLFSWDFPSMLAARFLQAFTTGLFFPVVSAVILIVSPPGKKASMISLNSALIGVGLAFSPAISGALITYVGLRSIFVISASMAVLLIIAGWFLLYDVEQRKVKKIDALSIALSFIGLLAFMNGLNSITKDLVPSLASMAVGVIALALFAIRQPKIKDPLLNLAPLKNMSFTVGEIITLMTFMSSLFMSLLAPLYLEGIAGLSPFVAGCYLIVPILLYAGSSALGGRIEDKHGIWPLVPIGIGIVILGLSGTEAASSNALLLAFLAFVGVVYFGIGLVFGPLKSRDLEAVDEKLASNASSIHSTLVQVATSIGSALFVGIMSADVDGATAAHATKAHAYAIGFSHTLYIDIGIAAVALIASVFFARIMHMRWKARKLGKGTNVQ